MSSARLAGAGRGLREQGGAAGTRIPGRMLLGGSRLDWGPRPPLPASPAAPALCAAQAWTLLLVGPFIDKVVSLEWVFSYAWTTGGLAGGLGDRGRRRGMCSQQCGVCSE